jgi:hypothetical protein
VVSRFTLTLVKCDMTHAAHVPSRLSRLALLSVWIVLLAWAAPAVVAVAVDLAGHSQLVADLAAEQSEITDVTDDPAVLLSSGRPGLHLLRLSLKLNNLAGQIWSPAPPLHPPTVLS